MACSRCGRARRGGCCSSAGGPAWGPTPPCSRPRKRKRGPALPCGFVPALSEDTNGWKGESGLITDVVDRLEGDVAEVDAYVCGPPPMVEAAIALLEARGVPEAHIYYDKFTTTEESHGD